jgi:DUF971 family protein
MSEPWPEVLTLKDRGRNLEIAFDNGEHYLLAAEYLRVESPSAEVKGHGPGQEVLVLGKENVRIVKLAPVGNYAVRIAFDDGHDSGLYTWPYLQRLGRERETIWSAYLARRAQHRM